MLKLGLICFKTISQTYKREVLEPIPVGDTVSKIILLSIYCLVRQNGGIFKILIACFHFAGIGPNQKQIRLPFSGKFLSKFIRHISHSSKKYCGNRCEFSNWSWEVEHGYEVRNTCYRFCASYHCLLSWQTPLERKVCFIGGKTRFSLCLQKKKLKWLEKRSMRTHFSTHFSTVS